MTAKTYPCMTGKYSAGLQRIRLVLKNATEPLSPRQIVKSANVSFWTFQNHYRRLLLSGKEMHIAGWYKHSYGWGAQFAAGQGETPPKPERLEREAAIAEWKKRTGYVDPRYAHRRLAKPRGVLAALLGIRA